MTIAGHITTRTEDGGIERISALGTDRSEICGAFKPPGQCTWSFYVTTRVVRKVQQPATPSIPGHLYVRSRQQARQWVELIAALYAQAS